MFNNSSSPRMPSSKIYVVSPIFHIIHISDHIHQKEKGKCNLRSSGQTDDKKNDGRVMKRQMTICRNVFLCILFIVFSFTLS